MLVNPGGYLKASKYVKTLSILQARKLILDEFGRELDEEGQVVPMKPQAESRFSSLNEVWTSP